VADIIPFDDKKTKKIRQEAQSIIDALLASPEDMTEEKFDRRSQGVLNKWQDHKKHIEQSGGTDMEDIEKLYTPEQVAEHLQVSQKTIRAYLRSRKLKGVKLGKEWRIKQSALKDFVDNLNGQDQE